MDGKQEYYEKKKHDNAVDEDAVDIERWQMVENKVIYGIAYVAGSIGASHEIDHKTDGQKNDTPKDGKDKFLTGPFVSSYNQFHIFESNAYLGSYDCTTKCKFRFGAPYG